MAKYIAYINAKDIGGHMLKTAYTEQVREELTTTIIGSGDKLAVLVVNEGITRVEVIPEV